MRKSTTKRPSRKVTARKARTPKEPAVTREEFLRHTHPIAVDGSMPTWAQALSTNTP